MKANIITIVNNGRRTANNRHIRGYTLIELIVVIALLGIMIGFTIPRFHNTLFLDDTKTASRWIIGKVQSLKEAAIQNQKQYVLHIDLDTDRVWETEESMSEENRENAALNAHALPGGIEVIGVEFPVGGKISGGQADITFYRAGYSDKALIHIQDDDEQLSFLIEPFFTQVKLFDKHAGFND